MSELAVLGFSSAHKRTGQVQPILWLSKLKRLVLSLNQLSQRRLQTFGTKVT